MGRPIGGDMGRHIQPEKGVWKHVNIEEFESFVRVSLQWQSRPHARVYEIAIDYNDANTYGELVEVYIDDDARLGKGPLLSRFKPIIEQYRPLVAILIGDRYEQRKSTF